MNTENLPGMAMPDDVEEQLSQALRRIDAPAGFTERVMARAARLPVQASGHRERSLPDLAEGRHPAVPLKRKASFQFTRPAWRIACAAAAVLAISAGALHVEHVRAEERRAEQAAAQFDEAMQVTGHALDNVSARLQQTQFGDLTKALEPHSGGGR